MGPAKGEIDARARFGLYAERFEPRIMSAGVSSLDDDGEALKREQSY
jgi:hypothetical protein